MKMMMVILMMMIMMIQQMAPGGVEQGAIKLAAFEHRQNSGRRAGLAVGGMVSF